jgi:hypothetical protein
MSRASKFVGAEATKIVQQGIKDGIVKEIGPDVVVMPFDTADDSTGVKVDMDDAFELFRGREFRARVALLCNSYSLVCRFYREDPDLDPEQEPSDPPDWYLPLGTFIAERYRLEWVGPVDHHESDVHDRVYLLEGLSDGTAKTDV